MSAMVSITWKFPKWKEYFQQKEEEIYLLIAATLQTNRGMMFDNSNAGRTHWEKPKFRDGQPLSQRGPLRQSFGPKNDGVRPVRHPDGIVRWNKDVVTIGTKVRYAAVHNKGAVIKPVRFPVLWIPLPNGRANSSNAPTKLAKKIASGKTGAPIVVGRNGKVYLLAKQVTIPKRPMDEWNASDQAEMVETVQNKVRQILDGAN